MIILRESKYTSDYIEDNILIKECNLEGTINGEYYWIRLVPLFGNKNELDFEILKKISNGWENVYSQKYTKHSSGMPWQMITKAMLEELKVKLPKPNASPLGDRYTVEILITYLYDKFNLKIT